MGVGRQEHLWATHTWRLWPFRKEPSASWRDQESQTFMGDVVGEGLWHKDEWISSKGADVAQDLWKSPSNPACWWGRGENPAYNKMFLSAEEGDDSWDEGRRQKCRAAPCVGKGRSPACRSQLTLGAAKGVTGSRQPTLWGGLTAHTPLYLGNFHLPTFRASSRDERAAALSLEGWPEDAGRTVEGNGCICRLSPLLGHGWASSGATWVGCCCSSLVQLSFYLYRASIPPALNGFLVSLIPSSSVFLACSP